ncbi:DUF4493 domain-containing protein [uncultured Alistipes sp.]|uniref:DUF4493 domain-containing protein n=1 Tax=uncultured Alistipes sp. TaxID=538949 RepID=UPI00263410C2|nr:DUF4493 domain-containing protein [uncultured Alistipes sp.]
MKRYFAYIIAAAALAAGCAEKEEGAAGRGFGRLEIETSADTQIVTRSVPTPPAGEFSLTLTGDGYEGRWESVDAFAQCDTIFREGNYTARIAWGDSAAEGADKVCYAGERQFTLQARRTNTVSVTATVANSQTRVRTTEQFRNYFHDASFTVRTGAGNTFDFAAEGGEVVFVQAGTTLKVSGTARRQSQTGTDEGPEVTFSATLEGVTKARTCHTFTFDASQAGSATVTILLDEGEQIIAPVEIELNDEATDNE